MSLAVYIGTEHFRDELKGDAQEPPTQGVTLSDIATGQPLDESEGQPQLLLSTVTEEALAALERWLKADAEHTCTLAWPHPSAWLAANLQQGSRPKEALWQWSYQADLIQKLYKRKRRQVTLEGYVPNATTAAKLPLVAQLTLNGMSPIYRLMAHQLTQEDSLLQQAYNYLKASSAHVAIWQLPAVETVEQSLHYLAQQQQQHKEAQANNEANQKQLKETTERLSEKSARLLETEKAKDTLSEQLSEAQAASAKQNQDHTYSVEQENAALLEQLMTVQEALEENILSNQAHQADLEEKEVKLNWLRKKTKSQEAKLEERKIALSQLQDEHKNAIAALEKNLSEQLNQQLSEKLSVQNAHSKLQKQYTNIEQQAIQSNQLLEQETIEKSLIIAQLHGAQEQLVKNTENAQYYKKQADSRQKTINILKQEQQIVRHQYESITQWLRVSGHRNAAAAYRYSRLFKRALPKQLAMIKESGFFDAQWYREQYPDVKTAGIEPAEHYLKFGAIEGRNPSDKFDTYFYLCEYPDVAISGQNPLLHYLRYGQHEERFPTRPRQQLPAPVQP